MKKLSDSEKIAAYKKHLKLLGRENSLLLKSLETLAKELLTPVK